MQPRTTVSGIDVADIESVIPKPWPRILWRYDPGRRSTDSRSEFEKIVVYAPNHRIASHCHWTTAQVAASTPELSAVTRSTINYNS